MTAPLNKLKRLNVDFVWTVEHDRCFDLIQHEVRNARILYHPDHDKPFYVQTDASDYAYGAMLFQYADDSKKKIRPIEFMSKQFHGSELNWHASEKEAFAVLQACKRWCKLIIGKEVTVLTDHYNLAPLLNNNTNFANRRLLRWAVFLQEFRITARYIKGEDNIPAKLEKETLARY